VTSQILTTHIPSILYLTFLTPFPSTVLTRFLIYFYYHG